MSHPFRTTDGTPVPAVTTEEMAAVDRVAVDEFGLALLSMMENAGRGLVERSGIGPGNRVVVLAGPGGNGGGGLVAARHLHNRGVVVSVVLDRPPAELSGAAARQWSVLDHAGVDQTVGPPLPDTDVVLDALLGYGLQGAPRGTAAEIIDAVPGGDAVVSLDVPSGVDATTGERPGVAVRPGRVVTLALPKTGLREVDCDLYCVDLGIPDAVFHEAGLDYVRPFGDAWSVSLERTELPEDK
jgi:NAD(P)H-hydrate epimerase